MVVGRRWQAPPTLTLEWGRRGGDGRGGDREGLTPASPRTAALPWSSSAGRARGGRPPRLLLQHRVTGSPAGPVHARPCVLFLLSKLAVSCSPIPGFKTNFYYNNLFILHLNYPVLKGHFKTPTALSLEEGVWSAGSSKMRTPLRTAGEDRARRQLPATQAPGPERRRNPARREAATPPGLRMSLPCERRRQHLNTYSQMYWSRIIYHQDAIFLSAECDHGAQLRLPRAAS